jgi:hypothetical protein
MTDESGFSGLGLQETIDLRWTLRDIRASAGNCHLATRPHLEKLETMKLIEMRGDEPALTKPG